MSVKGNYLPYLEARDFVRALGLKSLRKWYKYPKEDRPSNIPSNPNVIYKNCGWISWMDWLGTNNVIGGIRKHKVNDNYFKKRSSNMFYILGFWFADGYITKSDYSYIFGITQNKNDKYLLEEILGEMDSNYLLSFNKTNDCYSFSICSKTVYDDIIKLGGKERKSLNVKFPYIPDKYLPDFIRGLWDGDGSIYYNKQGKSYVSSYSSGSREFINGLFDALKKNILNLEGNLHKVDRTYALRFSKNDTVRLKKFMYQEPLAGKLMLKRKYDLFLKTPDYYSRDFLDYNNAQKIAKSLKIKNSVEWEECCKRSVIPHNVPRSPYFVYKNSGWIDWYVWLGKPRNPKTTT